MFVGILATALSVMYLSNEISLMKLKLHFEVGVQI